MDTQTFSSLKEIAYKIISLLHLVLTEQTLNSEIPDTRYLFAVQPELH